MILIVVQYHAASKQPETSFIWYKKLNIYMYIFKSVKFQIF